MAEKGELKKEDVLHSTVEDQQMKSIYRNNRNRNNRMEVERREEKTVEDVSGGTLVIVESLSTGLKTRTRSGT